MGSMNWLGFSLSPQELPNSQAHHEISGTDVSAGNCYDLISSHTPGQPGLNLPASYGLLEAFNRDNHSQDWNLKATLGTNSMLVGGTVATTTTTTRAPPTPACNQEPKLENFLGSIHSIRDAPSYDHHPHTNNGDYMFSNCSLELPSSNLATNLINPRNSTTDNNGTDNSGVNVSLIKTWLKNQPTTGSKNDIAGLQGGGLTSAQTLSLSMTSGGAETAQGLPLLVAGGGGGGASEGSLSDNNSNKQQSDSNNGISTGIDAQSGAIEAVPRKSIDTFGQRTSIYRGVTRHRWTGRYEAHLWDNSCRREGQTRKGRQVYLGGYDKEDKAARSYDLAALKYWGTTTTTNFPISNYEKEIEEMKHMTRQEYVASLRRKSSGFSRGASIYRGVTRHHQHGRWQARIGRVAGNKDLYLGTFSTQEEAAEAYDIAAIKFRGLNAVTNFEINRYDVKAILESSTLPIGGAAKRLKEVEELTGSDMHRLTDEKNAASQLSGGGYHTGWPAIAFQQAQPLSMQYQYNQQQRLAWCKQEQECDTTTQNSFQDLHQLQLGNTHNFFHQPSYNLMGLDSSSMEHSSGSNSIIYGGGGGDGGGSGGYGNNNGGYVMPSASLIGHEVDNGLGESDQVKQIGYENMYGSANMYYLSQQASGGVVKGSGGYDHQGSGCNNWISTVVPAMAPRSSNMAVCHGAPTFTVWNET